MRHLTTQWSGPVVIVAAPCAHICVRGPVQKAARAWPLNSVFEEFFMKWLRENRAFLLVMFALLAARSSFADHYVVPSGSMEQTLFPGDRVVVDKRAYGLRVPFTLVKIIHGVAPARGDVIIFDAPDDGTRLIKRIVAVGGDRLEVHHGHVF